MSKIEEIETAIEQLAPEEFTLLANWMTDIHKERWDQPLSADAEAGRLELLIEKARSQRQNHPTWP